MTAPVQYKTIKVSAETHRQIHDLAARLGGSADDALGHLLDASTIRVPVSDIQRERWSGAAAHAGVSLPEFIRMRVEAALTYGTDPGTLNMIYRDVHALCIANGITPTLTAPAAPSAPARSTTGIPL